MGEESQSPLDIGPNMSAEEASIRYQTPIDTTLQCAQFPVTTDVAQTSVSGIVREMLSRVYVRSLISFYAREQFEKQKKHMHNEVQQLKVKAKQDAKKLVQTQKRADVAAQLAED